MIGKTIALVALLSSAMPAQAHGVIASVFQSGDAIEGEIGFTSGQMAANRVVEVFAENGTKLGETTTDDDGFFLFTPTEPVTHVFKTDLGAGHIAQIRMEATDVAAILGKAAETGVTAQSAPTLAHESAQVQIASLTDEEKDAIAQIVRDETRPLRQEISAYKEKNDLQTILGGIGYIIGLTGIGFYIAARRKLREAA